jgi:hypothetical protein
VAGHRSLIPPRLCSFSAGCGFHAHLANPWYRTWGISGFGADSIFDIGRNALRIWGMSRQPNFDALRKIDSANSAIPNFMASNRY